MSDFVTRLAQRQLGQIKTAEPRLLEPYAPSLPFEGSRSVDASSEQSTLTVGFESPPSRSERASLIDSTLSRNRSSRDALAQISSQQPGPTKTQASSEAAHHALSHDPELEPMSEKHLSGRDQTQKHPVSQIHFMSDEIWRGTGEAVVHPLVPAVTPTRMSAPARLTPPRDPAGLSSSPHEQAHAESPVQVTIGRIEVTAVTQAASAKRAPVARTPSMSLENYLARRERRGS